MLLSEDEAALSAVSRLAALDELGAFDTAASLATKSESLVLPSTVGCGSVVSEEVEGTGGEVASVLVVPFAELFGPGLLILAFRRLKNNFLAYG